ncbi:MAG: 7-cyano-7-deazaguanine synthase [Acidobacteriia bacterium]|nr:7-cyano-7-deazaguanine synthase [Terriglobia bacterium]
MLRKEATEAADAPAGAKANHDGGVKPDYSRDVESGRRNEYFEKEPGGRALKRRHGQLCDGRPRPADAPACVVACGLSSTHGRARTPAVRGHCRFLELGIELRAPLHLTWSCYKNCEEACGECDSCALRLRGFQEAGVEDPIPYRRRPAFAARV